MIRKHMIERTATYSPSQLRLYSERIRFPFETAGIFSWTKGPLPPSILDDQDYALAVLTKIQQHHLSKVPVENLALHYSTNRGVSLDPQDLYIKIVENKRGGHCMEHNCFFAIVLRSLGFKVQSVGARVHKSVSGAAESKDYQGWGHMINIVRLSGGKNYMVDVGFGGNGPIRPILLAWPGSQGPGIYPAESRIVRERIPQTGNSGQKPLIYQHRDNPQAEWMPVYCFSELEFFPEDYEVMNFWMCQSPKSIFTQRVIAFRMGMQEERLVGTVRLVDGEVTKKARGVTERVESCTKEEERVEALYKYFGVELSEEEKAGIGGMVTELKG